MHIGNLAGVALQRQPGALFGAVEVAGVVLDLGHGVVWLAALRMGLARLRIDGAL